jgi:GAF domain-containing protein
VDSDPTLGMHSLATMARLLGRSQPLRDAIELAAEGARLSLNAASVSVCRYEPSDGSLHTMVNVGDLADWEARYPVDELYPVKRWPELEEVIEYGATRTDSLGDPHCDPRERELLTRLGKGASVTAAVLVDDIVWGEFYATRHVGHPPFGERSVNYVDVLVALLGGAVSRAIREAALVEQSEQ